MNFDGIILGVSAFLIIGLFHPIVIKAEYYFGKGCWWVFVLVAILFGAASIMVDDTIVSAILGVFSFSSLWTVLEIFEQEKRVKKGWFPANPKRKKK